MQKRIAIEVVIVNEAVKTTDAARVTKVAKTGKFIETYKVSKAPATAGVEMIIEESRYLTNKSKPKSAKTSTH